MALVDEVREACAAVAARARHVRVREDAIADYAATLPPAGELPGLDPEIHLLDADRETVAAYFLCLDAVNFGSGWFPTLDKDPGRSGYSTVAARLRRRFERPGGRPGAAELAETTPEEIAAALGQDPGHELMGLFAASLRDLAAFVRDEHGGSFAALADAAGGSAVTLVEMLAEHPSFADVSVHDGDRVPFLKRAQIAAADLHLAGVCTFGDLDRLTLFADNLVPHVLRHDGVLAVDPDLAGRIDAGELLVHGSPEEVELRACAVHAAELLVAATGGALTAQGIDNVLWNRGRAPRYKAAPRPRCRCTAY